MSAKRVVVPTSVEAAAELVRKAAALLAGASTLLAGLRGELFFETNRAWSAADVLRIKLEKAAGSS